jgi:TorA maturation chaperone TorD
MDNETDLCRVFGFAFDRPSPERFAWLNQTGLGKLPDYESYESLYIGLFDAGMPQPPVPLMESAHRKTPPSQQIVLENMDFYDVVGLKPREGCAPDHLITQLEFLSAIRYLRRNAPDDADLERLEKDFLERHLLSWLPTAQRKLGREKVPIFGALMDMLVGHLRASQPGAVAA